MKDGSTAIRPEFVRKIALWWQGELDRCAMAGRIPDLPSDKEVIERFDCTSEEVLRGVGLGEHRYFSGTE